MRLKYKNNFRSEYKLENENIDRIAVSIREYLTELGLERANIIRIRLMMEEALLRWQDRFGPEQTVRVNLDVRLRRPTITLELTGESFDPLSAAGDELGAWADSLLSSVGLTPRYSYQRGVNTVQLRLPRPRMSPALTLLFSVLLGLLLGLVGRWALPEALQAAVLRTVLDPIQQVFTRLLNSVAGPVIFFSVLAAVCSIGGVADMGKTGRRLIARFLWLSLIVGVLSALVSAFVFHPEFTLRSLDGTRFNGVLDFFLQFIPSDVLTPLITGDSPQLILVALVLGYALLTAGTQVHGLVSIVEQANTAALILAEWVSRLTPFFVTLLLVLGLWSGSLDMVVGLWKPLVVFTLLCTLVLLFRMLVVSRREGVGLRKLAAKMKESFLISLRTSSVDASFGANQVCCERRLGIDRRLLDYGLPLGLVIYMPAFTSAFMMITVYIASATGTMTSFLWYFMAVLLTVTLLAATPPVAGVGLLTFAVLFARLGIPTAALTAGMVADIIFGFIVAPLDQAMLQTELVLEADRLGMLNTIALKK